MAKNVAGFAGKGIALTLALAGTLFITSCKKDAFIKPVGSMSSTPNAESASIKSKPAKTSYELAQPVSLNGAHDITISGDMITGGALSCIDLNNCYNIHITRCKLINSEKFAVNLSQCSNIVIDSCYVENVKTGVYAFNSRGIQVKNNKMKDVAGEQPGVMTAFENLSADIKDAASNSAVDNELMQ
ncbi:right-handed parallel beta-helix repeat-containing protein [Mucilaginibacter sp.]|jgi:parallel beta-helix repeat protein|uniref:right-handed parallel beta-helix repeat-containing protein n=1 Tax=Mucilaginibacter sp. TaxID=1882438 RepID=UPI002B8A4C9A|nr:right-handed parallel beta-helix repeat-containing protein [Mucilaginibacter sp.]HTI60069.1 right-handed parallel beta-helix repeat-containing protein [Mucilaginibacter sp.]